MADRPSTYRMKQTTLARIERDDPEAAYACHRVVVHLLGERVLHLVQYRCATSLVAPGTGYEPSY